MFDWNQLHTIVGLLMIGNCIIGFCIGLATGYWIWS